MEAQEDVLDDLGNRPASGRWDGLVFDNFAAVRMPSGIAISPTVLYVGSYVDGAIFAYRRSSGKLLAVLQAAPRPETGSPPTNPGFGPPHANDNGSAQCSQDFIGWPRPLSTTQDARDAIRLH